MPHRLIFLIFTFIAIAVCPQARADSPQAFTWGVELGTVFDNREGSHDITPTETVFFTRLAPEIGFRFSASDRIAGGVVWTQPIGYEWHGARFAPTIYYRRDGARWSGSAGIFPREHLHEELPGFLWCDSLTYFQRNIRGGLVQWQHGRSFIDLYLDWRQRQTENRREAFNIVLHGKWVPDGKVFFAGAHAMMNHFARTKDAPVSQHIVDNFMVNPYVGVDLTPAIPAMDTLTVRLGMPVTIERNRGREKWEAPMGGWLEIHAGWKRLALKNSLYAGGALLPSYAEFGGQLYQGEPFYSKKFYNRTDISYGIIRNNWIDFDASLDFHVSPGSFIFYQRLLLRVYIDGQIPLRRRGKSE